MIGDVRAPELHSPLGWLNTDRPLQLAGELRGQVVVLDFWTYCCINCLHILPDLAHLEEKYANDPVVFIGVHSAKFTNEASRETIRAAIQRYEIHHPVVIDENMNLWRRYAVRSWPTVVVIDPTGRIVSVAAGEGNKNVIDAAIQQTLLHARANSTLSAAPLTIRNDGASSSPSGLSFPGKVLADEQLGRLFVADSNHNRIIIAELPRNGAAAHVMQVVGTGRMGRDDGAAHAASFHHPQGLACGHGKLYVADTENHLIRAIDLVSLEVSTVCGTGTMENDRTGGGMGVLQGLNSPWDLVMEGSTLYVAMAGLHQIWRIDLPVGFARALAGTGRENIVDGPSETAALAQPSGICMLQGTLYFADSEVSAIRGIDMASEQVFTVIGEGLFSFGDVDGAHPTAKLQHPLGVTAYKQSLLVADTYNHKIKMVQPRQRSAVTKFGDGRPGTSTQDGGVAFFEPGGLSAAGELLFVADTNNHRIVRVNLVTCDWSEISLEGLESPKHAGDSDDEPMHSHPAHLSSSGVIELIIKPKLPAGAVLSSDAPWSVRISHGGRTLAQHTQKSNTLPLRFAVDAASIPAGPIRVEVGFALCEHEAGVCRPERLTWVVPIQLGGTTTTLELCAS